MRPMVIVLLLSATTLATTTQARTPSFRYAATEGCGGIIVAGLNADRSEGLIVFADSGAVGLAEERKTFNLADASGDVRVRIDLFRTPRRGEVYCTNNGREQDPSSAESWHAVAGEVTVLLHAAQGEAGHISYAAVVSLENLTFRAPDGRHVRAPRDLALRARLMETANADLRVDTTALPVLTAGGEKARDPAFTYKTTEGCPDIVFAAISADRREALVIRADRKALGLSESAEVFNLARLPQGLSVRVDVLLTPRARPMYCVNAGRGAENEAPPIGETWQPVEGLIAIKLSMMRPEATTVAPYAAIARIENASFRSPGGRVVKAPPEIALYGRLGM